MSASEQDTSASDSSHESSDREDIGEILPIVDPYDGEPLASSSDDDASDENIEADEDGILYTTLEKRFRRTEAVDSWVKPFKTVLLREDKHFSLQKLYLKVFKTCCRCSCNECKVDLLIGAREFRCCWDIAEAVGKLTSDGTINEIKCVTNHPAYSAITNQTNLKMVAPLLKDRIGRPYRRRGNQTENEYIDISIFSLLLEKITIFSGRKIRVKFKF
ncbi:uncharacterized protein LOC135683380 [Rhopilema esculentum]|uniref:uncharacterized protein LOC135683380 n=1 Tax=Rhopilema esculentum TaxID=499914 RepID=UPI0031DAABD4